MQKDIVLFTATNCSACKTLKNYLDNNKISYQEVNIENNMEAQAEILSKGLMGVPVLRIEDTYLLGFDKEQIKKLLEL